MRELAVRLRLETPLFMGGADPNGEDTCHDGAKMEVRAAAIRGALRYWLRTVCGPNHPVETSVFGGQEQAGAVATIVEDGWLDSESFTSRKGDGYLYWSMRENKRRAAKEGSKFTLRLIDVDEEGANLRYAHAALWLLTRLGGIGSRSRRTGGSLGVDTIVSGEVDPSFPLVNETESAQELAQEIMAGISAITRLIPQRRIDQDVDSLSRNFGKCWVIEKGSIGQGHLWQSSFESTDDIGKKLQLYRPNKTSPRHAAHREWDESLIFGLPLTASVGCVEIQNSGSIDRRSSPLWLRISKIGNGYVGVATLFESTFLPSTVRLNVNRNDRPPTAAFAPPTSYQLVRDFVTTQFNSHAVPLP
jgi:CRISPR-associated protein Cmr1